MSEEQARFSIIRGLRPDIRQSVLQHEPTSIADIKKWATIAESSTVDSSTTNVAEAIRRLEEKFDSLQTFTVGNQHRGRSTSPRVRFNINSTSSRGPSPSQQSFPIVRKMDDGGSNWRRPHQDPHWQPDRRRETMERSRPRSEQANSIGQGRILKATKEDNNKVGAGLSV